MDLFVYVGAVSLPVKKFPPSISGILIESLFDIEKEMNLLTGWEEEFYQDQKTQRECQLSEEIDEELELEQQTMLPNEREKEGQLLKEQIFIIRKGVITSLMFGTFKGDK